MGPTIMIRGVEVPLIVPTALPIISVTAMGLLYIRACQILEARGRYVGLGQRFCFFLALFMILVATQSFIDPVGEESLMSMHMAQHMLLADLAAPLLLFGVRAPVLFFFWPKPILVTVARMKPIRRLWGWLRRPVVAMAVWLLVLYGWHWPTFYEASVQNRLVHDIQHVSFAATGVLSWWPLIDPRFARIEGKLWKVSYIFVARVLGGALGLIMLGMRVQIYSVYGLNAQEYGFSPLDDQQIAGVIMMVVDAAIVLFGIAFFMAMTARGGEYQDDLPEAARMAALDAHPDATDADHEQAQTYKKEHPEYEFKE